MPKDNADKTTSAPPQARADAGEAAKGTPLGDCSPDEPANTIPAEPVSISKVKTGKGSAPGMASDSDAEEASVRETPALHQESDIPSDGSDPEGEAMIREIPRRDGTGKQPGPKAG